MEAVLPSPFKDLNHSKSTDEWWFPEELEAENKGPYHLQMPTGNVATVRD